MKIKQIKKGLQHTSSYDVLVIDKGCATVGNFIGF